jgi:excinuclease ABC subunit C
MVETEDTTTGMKTGSFRPAEIDEIPRAPGVYMMLDAKSRVIYVGKALNLRVRVRQYFGGGDERISTPLIAQATHHIETILTSNEKEAFLLENTLIKRHRPRFNVRLRDDKTYVSVRIDPRETWPKAVVTRARGRDKALYFGPYTNAAAIRQTLNLLRRVFPLRSCADTVFRNRTRPCIQHQMGRCGAPCVGKITREDYAENVRNTIAFLRGRASDLMESLKEKMRESSAKMEYEKAAKLRDQIAAMESSAQSQRVVSREGGDRDVLGYHEEHGQAGVAILFFRGGQLVDTLTWVFAVYGETLGHTLSRFLGQHYDETHPAPEEVLLPAEPEDAPVIAEWLSDLRGGRVELAVPQRGEKLQLVRLASLNAREVLMRKLTGRQGVEAALDDLARRLGLSVPPRTIECYDIATLQGTNSAGSKVEFVDGEPHKSGYRLFKIRSVEGQDDFAMMREVLMRRFERAVEKKEELPDLVVVDGGKGQLAVAQRTLDELGIKGVGLAALVKEHLKPLKRPTARAAQDDEASGEPPDAAPEKERTSEYLLLPGRKNPVVFPPRASSFYLLQRLRDEAHRFVNSYHVKLRQKGNLVSPLRDVPGIGPRRAQVLLRHFGSLTRVKAASLDDLRSAPKMTDAAAQAVHRFFHPDEPRAPRLIIFDLDGTLVDTFHDIAAAANHGLSLLGRPEQDLDLIVSRVGGGGRNLMAKCLGEGATDDEIDRAFAGWKEYYLAHPCVHARPYPGVRETLEAMRRRGVRLAVLSNKLHELTVEILHRLELSEYFDAIQGETPSKPRKPDPGEILRWIEEYGLSRDEVVMVGDGEADVRVARNAGVGLVAVSYGVNSEASLREMGAREVVERFLDLLRLMDSEH